MRTEADVRRPSSLMDICPSLTRLLPGLRGPARRRAKIEREHDIAGRLLEFFGDGYARLVGQFADRLGVIEARKGHGHGRQPAVVSDLEPESVIGKAAIRIDFAFVTQLTKRARRLMLGKPMC